MKLAPFKPELLSWTGIIIQGHPTIQPCRYGGRYGYYFEWPNGKKSVILLPHSKDLKGKVYDKVVILEGNDFTRKGGE